jgi:hypothetical protein
MRKIVKAIWDFISGAATLWGFLPAAWQAAIVAGATAMTAYLGYEGGGLFWATIGASAVFAFTTAGLYYALLFWKQITVFERLVVEMVDIIDVSASGPKEDTAGIIDHITLHCILRNHGERNLFFQLRREHHSLGGRVNPDAHIAPGVNVIPPRERAKLMLATLNDLRLPKDGGEPLKGKLELEIEYGPREDNLCYLLDHVGELGLSAVVLPSEKRGELRLIAWLKRNTHKRKRDV